MKIFLNLIVQFFTKKENYFFLPLFIIYISPLFFNAQIPNGDGLRYWGFAENITNGFYAYDISNKNFLWNGPGWPLVLSIFLFFKLNVIVPALINCSFIFFSSRILFKLGKYLKLNSFLIIFIIYFIFLNQFDQISLATSLHTEPISILILLMLFKNFIFKPHSKKYLLINSSLTAFLILTKVIFFYIFLLLLILVTVYRFFLKSDIPKFLSSTIIISFLFISPYLFYTYKLTGEYLYFANSGGDIMYWSSNPNISELGQWKEGGENILDLLKTEKYSFLDKDLLHTTDSVLVSRRELNHINLEELTKGKSGLEIDLIKKRLAFENIINNPLIFTHNIIMNTSRLFLGYPYYLYFKPPYFPVYNIYNILKNSFLVFFFLASILIHFKTFRIKNVTENVLFLFLFSYLSITVLLANQSQRFLLPILPFIIIYIVFIINRKVSFSIKKNFHV